MRRTVLFVGAMLAFGAGGLALAARLITNPNLVRPTVYNGVYGGGWATIPIQFAVTRTDRVNNFAHAEAFCGPPQGIPLTGANVTDDKFTSITIPDSAVPIHITVTGTFETKGKAEGTGVLRSETIQGKPCVKKGNWTAVALPAGSEMCFAVDPDQVTHTTVTNMTCGEAETDYLAGLKESGNTFQLDGWDCTGATAEDPIASAICTQGKKTFRLP